MIMIMKNRRNKVLLYFVVFVLCTGVYGALIAFANQLLRKNGIDSPYTTTILIASTIYVYYMLWKWLCRKIDSLGKNIPLDNK